MLRGGLRAWSQEGPWGRGRSESAEIWGGIIRNNLGQGNCESKIAARQGHFKFYWRVLNGRGLTVQMVSSFSCRKLLQTAGNCWKRCVSLSPYRGNVNRYTKRPLQDSAIISSIFGLEESAFYCENHRVSCKCQQPSGWKIHRSFRWKMPFAVFRSGSGVSDPTSKRLLNLDVSQGPFGGQT